MAGGLGDPSGWAFVLYDAMVGHYQGTGSSCRWAPWGMTRDMQLLALGMSTSDPKHVEMASKDTYLRLSSPSHLPSVGRVVKSRSHAHPLQPTPCTAAPPSRLRPLSPPCPIKPSVAYDPSSRSSPLRGYGGTFPRHPLITLLAWEGKMRRISPPPSLSPATTYTTISIRVPSIYIPPCSHSPAPSRHVPYQ